MTHNANERELLLARADAQDEEWYTPDTRDV
jgi:hypothetical protein